MAETLKPLVFYDFPSKKPGVNAWNPNTWKTRYSLNYKGIPYKTIWVEYPDVASTLKAAGIAPHPTTRKPDGSPMYTLPVIVDPNTGTSVSDSLLIADYLDKTYPDKPILIPAGTRALHEAFLDALTPNFYPTMRFSMLKICEILNPRSEAYIREARKNDVLKMLNAASIEDVYPKGDEAEVEWKKFEEGMKNVAKWMDSNDRFVMGDTISFADFVLGGFLQANKKMWGEQSKEWKDIASWDGGRWGRLLEDLQKYDRDD
ncbi:hypothetical protein K435DRAFT_249049 [Dendrothele bispora CBS 962.96]|uniref:GST N-terminal domain-containing protein n=1 Tax=Dendrothele bispora (strain CBS 962.96) TaxID=1314807 RepID=A0A4V6T599_DENBC|nr:hypothetical protein K435DRAFT_249049 [Dendrothele bispora CBS 962.96]